MLKRLLSLFLTLCLVLTGILNTGSITAKAETGLSEEYVLYPKPQQITYDAGDYLLRNSLNVIFDDAIDDYTKARMDETAALKNLAVQVSSEAVDGMTNIYVGVHGSQGIADSYITGAYAPDAALFEKPDSYFMTSDNNVISILGKDTDAAFYGITTLYQIFSQLESLRIRNFTITDYADVLTRGFIEGYYGNPWSVEDRADLMTFGGYYKMNAYFYAPKDDPKHRDQWDVLYTEEELGKIQELAAAGNKSKCRYIYALHPFPVGNNFRFDTEEHYQEDLAKLKIKFQQVIDQGVRQIAILADDFVNPGGENGLRLLNDMTNWLKEVQNTYPDMKLALPYVPFDYMDANGLSGELQILKTAPENVQLVMTGGWVWGSVNQNFTSTFTANVGRGPFMWINWPCSDNSKENLIMGGFADFLHPGVDPAAIQGIMLNPMQQSEPSKVAIFGNAAYSWNIWQSKEEADEAWGHAFSFADHNTPVSTPASDAYRELSKHMINQNTGLQESVDLRPILEDFKGKMNNGTLTAEDITAVKAEFETLQTAAKTYRQNTGNTRTRDQIIYWLDCWDDTTAAAISYLDALQADLNGNTDQLMTYYTQGKTAFANSKSHTFWYVDHNEKAQVGRQHIVPFINAMESILAGKAAEIADPSLITKTYISDVFTSPSSGAVEHVFDEDDSTAIVFQNPNFLYKDNYVGVKFNKPIEVNSVRFAFGGGKNHFYRSKLQYTQDGSTWRDVPETSEYERPSGSEEPIEAANLSLNNVLGIRLIAVADNGADQDLWLEIKSIDINKQEKAPEEEAEDTKPVPYPVSAVTLENAVEAGGSLGHITDSDKNTELWLKASDGDYIPNNASVILDLGEVRTIQSVHVTQGTTNANDILDQGVIEYRSTDADNWETFGDVTASADQTITGNGSVNARYIRLRNTAQKGIWWRLAGIDVYGPQELLTATVTPVGNTIIGEHANINDEAKNNKFEYITDGEENTLAWMAASGGDGNISTGDGIQIMYSKDIVMGQVSITQGDDALSSLKVEYTKDGTSWHTLAALSNAGASVKLNAKKTKIKGLRITSTADTGAWWQLKEAAVTADSTVTDQYVYTNTDTYLQSDASLSEASLTPGEITLNQNDYIGLKLSNIKQLTEILVNAEYGSDVKLQTSKNAFIWEAAAAGSLDRDARYIRLVNTGAEPAIIQINQFAVTSNEVTTESIYEIKDMGIDPNYGSNDVRLQKDEYKIFDGDLSTSAIIADYPKKDAWVIFDLGKTVTINSLRYYVGETAQNYIRDAEFELADSPDASSWSHLLTLGDGAENTTDAATTAKEYAELTHDSSNPGNMYKEAAGLNETGRYLRVRFTAPYLHRFAQFNELVINNGAYTGVENNRNFNGTLEEKGHQPSYMTDGNLSTTYKPSKANGSMTYTLSEPAEVSTFRLVQSGASSNASVEAEFIAADNPEAETETLTVGTLTHTVSDFKVPAEKRLLSITVRWTDRIPEISEVITGNFGSADIDKSALSTLMATPEDENWTKNSKEAFNAAKAIAQAILDNEYAAQSTIDNARTALQTAIDNAESKADAQTVSDLQSLVDGKETQKVTIDGTSVEVYTSRSYTSYGIIISEAQAALLDLENLTTAEAQRLINAVTAAKNSLIYSRIQRELALTAVEDAVYFEESLYTPVTWDDFAEALKALQEQVTTDADGTASPMVYAPLNINYSKAAAALANCTGLKELLTHTFTEDLYSPESWNAYQQARAAAEDAVINGTLTSVQAAFDALTASEHNLTFKSAVSLMDALKEYKALDENSYTQNSFAVLKHAMQKAETELADKDDAQNKANLTAMQDAYRQLVSTASLNGKLAEADTYAKHLYTKDSYAPLLAAITEAKKQKQSGTAASIAAACTQIDKAIAGLKRNADKLEAYQKSMKLLDANKYTADSYKVYKAAYDALMALEVGNTEVNTFEARRVAYETAVQNLKSNEASKITMAGSLTIPKGSSKTLKATVTPSTAANKTITWTSSDKKVAAVDKNGKVKGIKAGTAIITAKTSNGKKATCKVTVAEVTLNASSMPLQVKKTTTALKVKTKYPSNDKVASWTSSNKKIATVDKNGKVKGIKAGKANITVTMKSGAKAVCKVTVQKSKVTTKSIKFDQKTMNLLKGKKAALNLTRNPITGTEKITWKTSNKKVVTVDKKGTVKAIKAGTATITAKTANGKTASCKITVPEVKLNASSMAVQVGKTTAALKITTKYPSKDKVASWTSSNKKVATVDKNGKVKGVKAGKANITVTMKSGAKAVCKVTVQKSKVTTKSIKLNHKSLKLSKGKKAALTATRNPISATEKITWTTSNKKVAAVDKNGKVTAKGPGKAVITAKTSNKKTAKCTVTVTK